MHLLKNSVFPIKQYKRINFSYMKIYSRSFFIISIFGIVLKAGITCKARRKIQLEFLGNVAARNDHFWRGHVVKVKKIPGAILSKKCEQITIKNSSEIQMFISNMNSVINKCDKNYAINLIEYDYLDYLMEKGLSEDIVESIKKKLMSIRLPVSSAHGDFIVSNIVKEDGHLALIDWDCYKKNSSFILDIIHFHINNICINDRLSWTLVVFKEEKVLSCLADILDNVKLAYLDAIIVYAVNRTALEIRQAKGYEYLNEHKIEKFIILHENLYKSLQESPF